MLLTRGAARVYAVDVGSGQLHASLVHDPRVVSLERTDSRMLTRALIPEPPTLIVCDVSFIGAAKALATPLSLASPHADLVALIKPQFEAGPDHVKKGVVRDAKIHAAVCAKIEALVAACGWRRIGLIASPIEGGDGNREFLIAAERP
mgnify:CR=1 FL=1